MIYDGKNLRKSVKSEWRMRASDFETSEPAEVIRSYGGSDKKETVGKWISDDEYVSINGIKSHGGMPYKLWTRDEPIPISPTDARILVRANLIKRVKR
ncbi:MAG: hypothetical protein AAGU10_15155 [Methanosarcina mazei]